MCYKSFRVGHAELVQEPTLHLIKPLALTGRGEQDSPIGVFCKTPYMALVLVNKRRMGEDVPELQESTDLRPGLGQNIFYAGLHAQSAVKQGT